ncbi:hypothetical protein BpHYR1_008576 [Brachionus plicatilis]|uniref:Uncharacterized protein n=1 Tax=Brachionus plicatilis TaxID=10195 RepID=A0A3M7QXG0_BRAPC|nr:hypothetical protein BpHYR1_008576 [Brachionus plicatilis]
MALLDPVIECSDTILNFYICLGKKDFNLNLNIMCKSLYQWYTEFAIKIIASIVEIEGINFIMIKK